MFGRLYIDFARWGFKCLASMLQPAERNIDMQNAIDTCHSKNLLLSESLHSFNQDKPTCQIIAVKWILKACVAGFHTYVCRGARFCSELCATGSSIPRFVHGHGRHGGRVETIPRSKVNTVDLDEQWTQIRGLPQLPQLERMERKTHFFKMCHFD